jgi:cellulose synthase/poly-beta-1,6-N-acetylglucosamine synthase-like glycosyltransferase
LGLNGLLLAAVGFLIIVSAQSQLAELNLEASQIERIAPTFYGLGISDAFASVFSFASMVLIFRERPAGRTLALLVGANHVLIGIGFYLLISALFPLYFIASRGLIIVVLAWNLASRNG